MFAPPRDIYSRPRFPHPEPYVPPLTRPMPAHWQCRFGGNILISAVLELNFRLLCLASFGSRNLNELWSQLPASAKEAEKFVAYKDRIISRISVITVAVSSSYTLLTSANI